MFPETHEFLSWADSVPPYSQTAAEGIPHEAYVHTVQNEVSTAETLPTSCMVQAGANFISISPKKTL